MIINIRAKNWPAIIDEVVANYDASLPVVGDEDIIVGSVWLIERGPSLIVLDLVQPGALNHWNELGRDVLIINRLPSQETEGLDILVVTDEHDLNLGFSSLHSENDDQLVSYIEEALGL